MEIPQSVPVNGFYHHYKHDPSKPVNHYAFEVIGVGCHTEDTCRPQDANMVVYRPLYEEAAAYQADKLFYLRPLEMFLENVAVGIKTIPRFQKITNPSTISYLEEVRDKMYGL